MKKRLWIALLALVSALCLSFGVAACEKKGAGKGDHTHVAESFQSDNVQHWKVCTVCGEKFSAEDHMYDRDNACEICGYDMVYTQGLRYEYYEDGDTYSVTGIGTATDTTELVIPAYHDGKPVDAVDRYAFRDCDKLTSVVMSNSVIAIGKWAFHGCSALVNIRIPDGVIEIMEEAFLGTAYYNNAENWDESGVLYIGNHLIKADETKIAGEYVIREGTKSIAGCAFAGEEIDYEFFGCPNLTNVVMPEGLASIVWFAFASCSGLTDITIPDSVTMIGCGAFSYCNGLTSITIPESVTTIEQGAFEGCSGLKNITLPDGVTTIEINAFAETAYYNNEENWDESGVLYIGNHLIKADETKIAGEYIIREGTKSIAEEAFDLCDALTDITIPDSVTSIGGDAFDDCSGLTSIVIPESVTKIGDSAFSNCDGLTNIVIPGSVTKIEDYLFSACDRLESVTFGSGVTQIGNHIFLGCGGLLTSITIPDSVTKIGDRAFEDCTKMKDIHYGGTYTKWKEIFHGRIVSDAILYCQDGSYNLNETV